MLGVGYKIQITKDLKGDDGGRIHGWCDVHTKVISIDSLDTGDVFVSTLIHEINHAVLHESGVGQTSLHSDVEEIIVEQIAKVITQAFCLQPKGKIT